MAENLEISLIPALLMLPLLLKVAALHYLLGITVLTALPGLVLWYYYATHRKKRRTLFFLTLALYSLAYMYYLFITEILPRGDVSQLQVCTVTSGMIFTIVSLIHTKKGPGFVTAALHNSHSQEDKKESTQVNNGSLQSAASPSGTPAELQTPKEGLGAKWSRWLKVPSKSTFQYPVFGAMAENLEISLIPALLMLPLLLKVAALHYLLGITVLTALPGLVLWYYYATHRKKRRTLFFLTLALYSLAYMYYLFITEILPRGDVSQLQVCTVTSGMIFTIVSLIHTKKGPGFVTAALHNSHSQEDKKESTQVNNGSLQSAASPSGTPAELQTPKEGLGAKWSRCPLCKIMRPPRAGHCRTCGSCVQRLDHHCIWINSCVGQANHRSFLLTLSVFVLTSLYGISLVLCSLCPHQYLMTALFYCPGVYTQSSTALCFTCAWYSSIVAGGLLYLLVAQVLNISFNVTEREAQLALRNKTGQSRLWGLVVDTGEYSRGFYQNWVEFLTMTDASASPRSSLTDLV
ncbi:palmitoyltransferase ZDHHC23-like [Pundamilia nyererei]|uniref:Palmitoyltransferase n=1 Tax=Pundamilia nyererei TaxID=303518 RepID=A0A9Y6JBN7_9CICH|nr:PREDICTED: palmitoyltransferase ZDHHC23-like [Pundamilia nyererei]